MTDKNVQSTTSLPRQWSNMASIPMLAHTSLRQGGNEPSSWRRSREPIRQYRSPQNHLSESNAEIGELDEVKTLVDLAYEGSIFPAGSIGVAVLKHGKGEAFEIELFEPCSAVVTLGRNDIERL